MTGEQLNEELYEESGVGYMKYCATFCLVWIIFIGGQNLEKPKDFMGKKSAEIIRKYLQGP